MTRPRPTASKRDVQQHKREKAQAKAQRRAARRETDPMVSAAQVESSESELIDELARLHHDAESGQVTGEEFEERREHIRQQIERLQQ